jgi:superfamily I DNA/RNA helicase
LRLSEICAITFTEKAADEMKARLRFELEKKLDGTSENPKLCVTLPRQNAHLPNVNSAFVSVASLDFGVFGGCLDFFVLLVYLYFPKNMSKNM